MIFLLKKQPLTIISKPIAIYVQTFWLNNVWCPVISEFLYWIKKITNCYGYKIFHVLLSKAIAIYVQTFWLNDVYLWYPMISEFLYWIKKITNYHKYKIFNVMWFWLKLNSDIVA